MSTRRSSSPSAYCKRSLSSRSDGKIDIRDAQKLVGFLKVCANTCHHGKEEGVLFPAMAAG